MSKGAVGCAEHLYDIAAWIPEGAQYNGGRPVPEQAALQLHAGRGSDYREVVEFDMWGHSRGPLRRQESRPTSALRRPRDPRTSGSSWPSLLAKRRA
eukprot:7151605-Heterocapsa_arctica.AAC.1